MQAKHNSGSGAAAAATARTANASAEQILSQSATAPEFCAALAKLFGVRPTEVALMRLERGLLGFLYPEQLKTAGSIPFPVLQQWLRTLHLPENPRFSTLSLR